MVVQQSCETSDYTSVLWYLPYAKESPFDLLPLLDICQKKIKKYLHLHECLQKWWEYLNLMTRCHKIFQNLQDNGNTFNEMYGVFEFIDNKWSSFLGWPYYICIE